MLEELVDVLADLPEHVRRDVEHVDLLVAHELVGDAPGDDADLPLLPASLLGSLRSIY